MTRGRAARRESTRRRYKMRRKVSAPGWRFPMQMTRKQWSLLPYHQRHFLLAFAQCNLLGYFRDCKQARCRRAAALPRPAAFLLESQPGDAARARDKTRKAVQAVARAASDRLAQGL